jgi:hypothetical protein
MKKRDVGISQFLILMTEAVRSSETSVIIRLRDVTSQKTAIFIVTNIRTSNLANVSEFCTDSERYLLRLPSTPSVKMWAGFNWFRTEQNVAIF